MSKNIIIMLSEKNQTYILYDCIYLNLSKILDKIHLSKTLGNSTNIEWQKLNQWLPEFIGKREELQRCRR